MRVFNVIGLRSLSVFILSLPLMLADTGAAEPSTPAAASQLRIAVKGRHLVDAKGNVLQLRGVNLSGLEFVAVQGWSPNDPWGNQYSDRIWKVMQDWKVNAVRIPLNEASWLGYSCVNGLNKVSNPDPGSNYKRTVQETVDKATQHGMYVILDLHLTAPNDASRAIGDVKAMCPMSQNPMPDEDHSIAFWESLANAYKGYPNVIFELFNEPYFDWKVGFKNDWEVLRDGGTFRAYLNGQGFIDNRPWKAVGIQTLLNTVRRTGATNIVLTSGPNWAQRLDGWLKYKPTDPLNQLAAAWHAYPAYGSTWGTEAYTKPSFADSYELIEGILAANIPVLITEIGDRNANGTSGSPFVSKVLPWADRQGVSYLGWTFNVWPQKEEHVLLKSASGTPTDGYGQYFKQHLACVAQSTKPCP